MERKLDGIALISFATLLYCISEKLSLYLDMIGMGFAIPWSLVALMIGVSGLVLVFKNEDSKQWLWLILPMILAVYILFTA